MTGKGRLGIEIRIAAGRGLPSTPGFDISDLPGKEGGSCPKRNELLQEIKR
jgi:hypothetical protein